MSLFDRARQYFLLDIEEKQLAKRKKEIREEGTGDDKVDLLLEGVLAEGYEDDKGHMYLDFPEPVGNIVGLKRERVVSTSFDAEGALALVKARGLEKECIEYVPRLNMDAFEAAVFAKKIPLHEFEKLKSVDVTYRLQAVKKGGRR